MHFVMERCDGDLLRLISNTDYKLDIADIKAILYDILSPLQYIHKRFIAHRVFLSFALEVWWIGCKARKLSHWTRQATSIVWFRFFSLCGNSSRVLFVKRLHTVSIWLLIHGKILSRSRTPNAITIVYNRCGHMVCWLYLGIIAASGSFVSRTSKCFRNLQR